MNSVSLIGRLTRDPDVRYGSETQMAVARFTIAIDRQGGRNGEKQTDFPSIVCFGKTAELVEKYMSKGRLVGIQGRIQTGSYTNKDGQKIYTTDVVADRVEFLDRGDRAEGSMSGSGFGGGSFRPSEDNAPEGFSKLTEDDIPF
ncbi:MAG: single-stranded DNA-binding protein [Clostridia bacterium]|nr:single-stranded DNA-binding protein [Clostridia bacterium]